MHKIRKLVCSVTLAICVLIFWAEYIDDKASRSMASSGTNELLTTHVEADWTTASSAINELLPPLRLAIARTTSAKTETFAATTTSAVAANKLSKQQTDKLVITWIDWPWKDKNYWFTGVEYNPEGNCTFSRNWSLAATADAVLVYWPQTFFKSSAGVWQPRRWLSAGGRTATQKYVFVSDESAAHYPVPAERELDNLFNWTMTYRLDSDIPWRYGWKVRRDRSMAKASSPSQKSKLIAQFLSVCTTPSGRENVTSKLKEYVPVDVYGYCGDKVCPRSNESACREMLERDYFFYLAFENSACIDYVSEKLFKVLERNIIPIVLSRRIASAIVPSDSFIAVDDFRNIKGLAEYLVHLSKNTTAYAAYFEWKRHFTVATGSDSLMRSKLCAALHNSTLSAPGTVASLHDWWTTKSQCYRMSAPE